MHNQPKNFVKQAGCPKRKGPSQYMKKPDIGSYVDPLLYQSSSSNEPHGSTSSWTPSISNTSQLTPIPSYIHPTASITTSSVPSSQSAVTSQHTGTNANINTLIAAAITQPTLTNQINLNSSYQFPFNASQTQ